MPRCVSIDGAALAAETDDTFRGALSVGLAIALARSGDADSALGVLRPMNGGSPDPYLFEIAREFEAAHRPGEAFATLNAMSNSASRAAQLVELAEKLPN